MLKRVREERRVAEENGRRSEDLETQVERLRDEREAWIAKLRNSYSASRRSTSLAATGKQQRQRRVSSVALAPRSAGGATTEVDEFIVQTDKRHQAELRGLVKQIQFMRSKVEREERFRRGMAFEKRFLLMQIECFREW